MDFEQIQDWINGGLCISPQDPNTFICKFCPGQNRPFCWLGGLPSIKRHFKQGIHCPSELPIAPPDENTQFLENFVRKELVYDDNLRKWVTVEGAVRPSDYPFTSHSLLYFGVDVQRWLVAVADVLIHSRHCSHQWPYTVKDLCIVPRQLVSHSPRYVGKKQNLELYALLNMICTHHPSEVTINVPTADGYETLEKKDYRGLLCKVLCQMTRNILQCTNKFGDPPIHDLWFLTNIAVLMNQYFCNCHDEARVLFIYCKAPGYTHLLDSLRKDLHCGDTRKYKRQTTFQRQSHRLTGRTKRPLERMPEEFSRASIKKGKAVCA